MWKLTDVRMVHVNAATLCHSVVLLSASDALAGFRAGRQPFNGILSVLVDVDYSVSLFASGSHVTVGYGIRCSTQHSL